MNSAEIFLFSSFTEKISKKRIKICHNLAVDKFSRKTLAASGIFLFHSELWAKNTNRQHRLTHFAISKGNFSENLYATRKTPP